MTRFDRSEFSPPDAPLPFGPWQQMPERAEGDAAPSELEVTCGPAGWSWGAAASGLLSAAGELRAFVARSLRELDAESDQAQAWMGGVRLCCTRLVEAADLLEQTQRERDEALAALKDEMQWDMGGVPENEWMARALAAEAVLYPTANERTNDEHDSGKSAAAHDTPAATPSSGVDRATDSAPERPASVVAGDAGAPPVRPLGGEALVDPRAELSSLRAELEAAREALEQIRGASDFKTIFRIAHAALASPRPVPGAAAEPKRTPSEGLDLGAARPPFLKGSDEYEAWQFLLPDADEIAGIYGEGWSEPRSLAAKEAIRRLLGWSPDFPTAAAPAVASAAAEGEGGRVREALHVLAQKGSEDRAAEALDDLDSLLVEAGRVAGLEAALREAERVVEFCAADTTAADLRQEIEFIKAGMEQLAERWTAKADYFAQSWEKDANIEGRVLREAARQLADVAALAGLREAPPEEPEDTAYQNPLTGRAGYLPRGREAPPEEQT